MKHFIFILLLFIFLSPGVNAQYNFTASVIRSDGVTLVVELTASGINVTNNGGGCTYRIVYNTSVKFYRNGIEMQNNLPTINTLQGTFICENQTSFFGIPNSVGTTINQKSSTQSVNGLSNCTNISLENLMCKRVVFQIGFHNGGNGYSGSIEVEASSPLPIELIAFDAIKKDRQVELSWKTATETNNDFFTIARSVDGKYWEDLQYIEGAGNSVQVQEYSYTDDAPYAGISYYRLTQTDFDGTQKTFPIVSVEQKDLEVLQAYPNPVVHTVTLMGVKENQAIRIFNAVGIEVTENTQVSISPSKKTLINMNDLPKGVYYIVNGAKQIKVLKQ